MSGAARRPDSPARRTRPRERAPLPRAGARALGTLAAGAVLLATAPLAGQAPAPPSPDTLRLGELHEAVRRADPRARQVPLHRRATRVGLEGLDGRWLPQVRLTGEGTYQTEVPAAVPSGGAGLPGGVSIPRPPRERFEVALEVRQLLWDGDRVSRRGAVERTAGAERIAGARASLYGLREELDGAFFAALRQQERAEQLRLLLDDLEARRRLVAARVRGGSQLPAELAAVEAARLRARQELDAAGAARVASLERLSLLLDREVAPGAVLSVPDLAAAVGALRRRVDAGRPGPGAGAGSADGAAPGGGTAPSWSGRPEWRRLARAEEHLRARARLADAETSPEISAFVRGAVGRPGLDFFDDDVSPYALMGVRMNWSLLDGGGAGARERALRLRALAARTERRALGEALRRRAASVLPEIDRLVRALATDDRLVELEEKRRRTALRQLEEGVLLPSEYVERRTDVFEARLRRRLHRVRLAQERARLLRILGDGVPVAGSPAGLETPIRPLHDDTGARP